MHFNRLVPQSLKEYSLNGVKCLEKLQFRLESEDKLLFPKFFKFKDISEQLQTFEIVAPRCSGMKCQNVVEILGQSNIPNIKLMTDTLILEPGLESIEADVYSGIIDMREKFYGGNLTKDKYEANEKIFKMVNFVRFEDREYKFLI